MPELPEVEEVRRSMEPHLLNITIKEIRVHRPDFVTPNAELLQKLVTHRIVRTFRHGKKLFTVSDDGQILLLHLGMSGRVDCVPAHEPLAKHTHVVLILDNGREIRFNDPRRFGGLWYYASLDQAHAKEIQHLGKDALDLTPADLKHWRKTRGRLKQRLLSQSDVAGLGNIYVDEALWLSQLHPLQRVDRIPPAKIAALVKAIRQVLGKSLAMGGTTLRDYRNASNQQGDFKRKLKAYGRAGKPCLRCQNILKSAVIAGRTTVFCPVCQKCR